ncbi:AMIN domain-containing protein [Cohnella sp. CFH 77786]|uniref:N-acetylmuramoyl-L-alanine amidase family protein n=1 Tax=Cohnella sp. CFH 77786 TaxID=2662265 RepID=UPI001C60E1F0|nr:N-acetylmuramoyl-L-alanine amidase family protein [Cohnella sp. CFH 77786]MBW5446568.1 AMIN domain-containing protein [Cohnella sp. CFH 77786]
MKKWISLLFVAVVMLCVNVAWTSAAAQPKTAVPVPKLYMDGKALEAKEPPAMVHNSVLVPIRTVAEKLGYKVGWDSKKKQVTVEQGSTKILMTLNNPKATVNGKTVTLVEAPILKSDTTLIPLRFVGETFGIQFLWDNASKSVYMFSDKSDNSPDTGSVGDKPDTGTGGESNPTPGTGTGTGSGSTPATGDGSGTNAGTGTGTGTGTTPGTGTGSGTGTGTGSGSAPGMGTGTTPGTGTGSGTGATPGTSTGGGTQTGSSPDGGLIGVVEGADGSGGTGATNGNAGAGGSNGSGTTAPDAATAHLHQIRYEPDAVIITYDGTTAPTSNVLTGPDRIVIDIPNADYAADFAAGYANIVIPDFTAVKGIPGPGQIAELPVSGHEALTKVRYSQYSDNPKQARIVLDLSQAWGYDLTNNASTGEIRIVLKKPDIPVKTGYTVVLDAGHGGSDPGAQSITGKWEKDFNLSVVLKVQAILAKESKINLVLTRQGDTYPTLDDRVNLANSLKADLFLSVHANSYTPSTNGTETYYNRAESLSFAKILHNNVIAAGGLKDNGVRTANYKVIKATTMPAVLLETGYLSNASDEKKLFNEEFQNRVAEAIAASIKQYFHLS